MALTWEQHQKNIFGGESGGDYDALFGFQNRPNGMFSDVKVSEMSIGEVLDFTNPRGKYGQYVARTRPDPEKGVATPVGAYQVVGSTLRKAVDALGLDPNTKFDKATQDKIGQYILKTQGTGAWVGYGKGGASMNNKAVQMTQPQQGGMLVEPEERKGLLAGLLGGQGIGQRLGMSEDFRDKLKMGLLMGSDPRRFAPMVDAIQAGMQERSDKAKLEGKINKTVEWLKSQGREDLAGAVLTGTIDPSSAINAVIAVKKEKTPTKIQEYNFARSQGYEGTFEDWQKSGDKAEFGTIPAGYRLVKNVDDQGKPSWEMVPVEGSPDWIEAQERKKQQEMAKTGKIGTDLSFYSAGERVLDAIDNDPTIIPKTGILAGLVKDTVFGQKQKNVAEDLAIMEAQMQFETLAQLKAQSPSGASGLGQLTDSERRALGKVKYNFEATQGEGAIKRNIKSAMMFRSYFQNGLFDPKTNSYRNATEEELDLMTKGINPFTQEGGPVLVGVGRYLGSSLPSSPNVQVIGNVTIEEVTE